MKKRQSGYSLVEVLIAMAITSVVLLTVVTLFYMGRRNVYSGKQMTYAVSVGTRVMEDLSNSVEADVLTAYNITDATATGNVTVNNVTYANSLLRDTTGCTANGTPPPNWTCTNDPNGYLANYKDLVTQGIVSGQMEHGKLTNAVVGLILTPTSPANAPAIVCPSANCPWTTARFLKIRVFIQWDEGQARRRIAFFDTTKVNRE
jgi:prepilin-type N-terminal cleavage/methylation domain-containing protein